MRISKKNQKYLAKANFEINKNKHNRDKLYTYTTEEIRYPVLKTFFSILHKIKIKVLLCFMDEERAFNFKKNKIFFDQVEEKLTSLKEEHQNTIICAYSDKSKREEVLIIFKNFFKEFEATRIEVSGDYLNIYYSKNEYFGKKEIFYLSVFIEINTRDFDTENIDIN